MEIKRFLKRLKNSETKFFNNRTGEIWNLENHYYLKRVMKSGTPEEVRRFFLKLPRRVSYRKVLWINYSLSNRGWYMEDIIQEDETIPSARELLRSEPNKNVSIAIVEDYIGTRPTNDSYLKEDKEDKELKIISPQELQYKPPYFILENGMVIGMNDYIKKFQEIGNILDLLKDPKYVEHICKSMKDQNLLSPPTFYQEGIMNNNSNYFELKKVIPLNVDVLMGEYFISSDQKEIKFTGPLLVIPQKILEELK